MRRRLLPGWSWHVGWNASGVLPYARIESGPHRLIEAAGPTVPLALLRALVAATLRVEDEPESAAPEAQSDPPRPRLARVEEDSESIEG